MLCEEGMNIEVSSQIETIVKLEATLTPIPIQIKPVSRSSIELIYHNMKVIQFYCAPT